MYLLIQDLKCTVTSRYASIRRGSLSGRSLDTLKFFQSQDDSQYSLSKVCSNTMRSKNEVDVKSKRIQRAKRKTANGRIHEEATES